MGIKLLLDPKKEKGTWKWGVLSLLFLAPFFFLTYGFANQFAANLSFVPSIMFEWERHIPLWPWTIIPYWSIDLFYGLSLLLCWNKFELKQQTLRLFSAQLISISFFLLYPLKFSMERPELHGFFGVWFDILMGFDKPFNQAPSLHIVLLVILWDFYRRHAKHQWKYVVDIWSLLIGISVLTTWQHHFIDIPTGILVGALCLWLFPVSVKSPFKSSAQKRTFKHLKLASFYLLGTILHLALASYFKGIFLWLLYPALSCLFVAFAYIFARAHFFQKQNDGRITIGALILFAPYTFFAWLNSRLWTRKHPDDSFIINYYGINIFLGRIPSFEHQLKYQALLDCCTELSRKNQLIYNLYPSLDLIPIQSEQLIHAVDQFDDSIKQQSKNITSNLLVFCALGYSRSTSILIAWLLKNHIFNSFDAALSHIQQARPWIVLNEKQKNEIEIYVQIITKDKKGTD